jgi:hypothetical protein
MHPKPSHIELQHINYKENRYTMFSSSYTAVLSLYQRCPNVNTRIMRAMTRIRPKVAPTMAGTRFSLL